MKPSKLDAGLLSALNDLKLKRAVVAEPDLNVFVATNGSLAPDATAFLREMGIDSSHAVHELFTACLSPNAVRTLSDQSWVKYIKLASPLRLREEK